MAPQTESLLDLQRNRQPVEKLLGGLKDDTIRLSQDAGAKLLREFIPRLCHESDGLILQVGGEERV